MPDIKTDYGVKVKTAPNQKVIRIPNRIIKNDLTFDITSFDTAVTNLAPNAFKLWLYFHRFPQNIDIALSSNDFITWSNTSNSTYDRAVRELIDLGYLVPTVRKNYFIFVDNPQSIQNSIYISPDETMKNGSKGEIKITALLTANNISFIREATFGTCLFEDTGYPARFDFYINDKYLIEFDGEQHFNPNSGYWKMEDGWFEKIQARDKFKNDWCKENNIPLIRIPYTKLDTLCIEDLMLETTEFRTV
jgi:hypothetical protein